MGLICCCFILFPDWIHKSSQRFPQQPDFVACLSRQAIDHLMGSFIIYSNPQKDRQVANLKHIEIIFTSLKVFYLFFISCTMWWFSHSHSLSLMRSVDMFVLFWASLDKACLHSAFQQKLVKSEQQWGIEPFQSFFGVTISKSTDRLIPRPCNETCAGMKRRESMGSLLRKRRTLGSGAVVARNMGGTWNWNFDDTNFIIYLMFFVYYGHSMAYLRMCQDPSQRKNVIGLD